MILVTLGTQKQPFTRLLDYIEHSNIDDEIIVQAGHTKYSSQKMKIIDFMPYDQMEKLVEKADLIITHAGTGSIVGPLKKGKKVIACARKEELKEHVDNHQEQIVEVFKEEGYILEINDDISLDELYKKLKDFKPKKFISNSENFIKNLEKEINKPYKSKYYFWTLFFIFLILIIILFLLFII